MGSTEPGSDAPDDIEKTGGAVKGPVEGSHGGLGGQHDLDPAPEGPSGDEPPAGGPPDDEPAVDEGAEKPRKVSREEAREAAEAERIAQERRAQEEALELARADAERLLAGPGLVTPEPPIPPVDLEAGWSAPALDAVREVRADLDGHRVGLAISGGGALGSFEAGVLRFLYDHLHIDPVAICGNSAGGLNAAKLAEGRHSDRSPVDEVERLWRSMRINSDMWEPEPWLVRLHASASWAAELRDQVSEADGATGAVRVAVRVVGSLVRRPPETDGTIDAVREAIRAQSLLSLAPVEAIVERELNHERILQSGIALRVGTVSLESGQLRYVTETGELRDRHDRPIGQPNVDLARGVVASASIPMAFPPVELNGEHYVDGGAREILPLEILVTKMGVERAIAISASSATTKPAGSFAERNMIDILRRVSAEIAPNETLRKELNPPGGWDPHVRLVVPEFDVHDSMTIDPALIAISLDHGYMRAADAILLLGEEAAELTEQITRRRIALRHLAGPVRTFLDTALGRDRRERIEGRGSADQDAIEVEIIERDGEVAEAPDDDHGSATPGSDGVVRSARSRTATTVAKLVKVIGRDHDDDHLDHDDADVGPDQDRDRDGGDADPSAAGHDASGTSDESPDGARRRRARKRSGAASGRSADRAGGDDVPHTVTVEVGVADDDGADVAVHRVDGAVEVVIAPKARPTTDDGAGGDVRNGEGRGGEGRDGEGRDGEGRDGEGLDGEGRDEVPDLDADQSNDAEAEAARRAEVRAVTAELRALVQQRHDLGLPLPQTLVAWLLRESDDVGPDPLELHPVGGSALGGV